MDTLFFLMLPILGVIMYFVMVALGTLSPSAPAVTKAGGLFERGA